MEPVEVAAQVDKKIQVIREHLDKIKRCIEGGDGYTYRRLTTEVLYLKMVLQRLSDYARVELGPDPY